MQAAPCSAQGGHAVWCSAGKSKSLVGHYAHHRRARPRGLARQPAAPAACKHVLVGKCHACLCKNGLPNQLATHCFDRLGPAAQHGTSCMVVQDSTNQPASWQCIKAPASPPSGRTQEHNQPAASWPYMRAPSIPTPYQPSSHHRTSLPYQMLASQPTYYSPPSVGPPALPASQVISPRASMFYALIMKHVPAQPPMHETCAPNPCAAKNGVPINLCCTKGAGCKP
ncbi:hypothetical protein COO60DRAFT_838015 [Scenedesmus sp. NREL 46B-D3]|nr:hypothetical protein COO60DRAFT_838015 [Scenedesmus sp. NREL 46B-D3]